MGFMQGKAPWVSMGLDAAGTLLGAGAAKREAAGDAAYYEQRAALNDANADQALITGQYQEGAVKAEATRTAAAQKAAFAANGVQVGSKTPLAVQAATIDTGALDAAMLHFNATRAAFGMQEEADLYRMAAANAKRAGKGKQLATLLGGATSLASKWDTFKQSGAVGGSSKSYSPYDNPGGSPGSSTINYADLFGVK